MLLRYIKFDSSVLSSPYGVSSLPGAERCRFQSLQTCYHLFNIFVFLFAFHIGQPLLQLSKVVLDNGLERRVGTEALLIALHLLGIVDIVGQNMGFFHQHKRQQRVAFPRGDNTRRRKGIL